MVTISDELIFRELPSSFDSVITNLFLRDYHTSLSRLSNLFIRELIFGWISKHKFIGQLLQTSLQVVYVLCMYTKTRVNFPKISSLISSENKSCLKVALQFKGNFFTLFVLQLSFCHLRKICFC